MDDPYPSYFLIAQVPDITFSYILFNGIALIFLLIGSALVSGSEVAFFSLTKEDLSEISETNPDRGRLISKLVSSPKRLLSTILILNNLINIAIVTLTTFVSWSIFGMNATGIVVVLIQTVGVTSSQRSMLIRPKSVLL